MSTNKLYLPLDYRKVPWDRRPLAMRTFERAYGQPFEEIASLMWYKYRRLTPMTMALNLEITTLRRWLRKLGLYICIGCSFKTGYLKLHTEECPGCGRYFCNECIQDEDFLHFFSGWKERYRGPMKDMTNNAV